MNTQSLAPRQAIALAPEIAFEIAFEIACAPARNWPQAILLAWVQHALACAQAAPWRRSIPVNVVIRIVTAHEARQLNQRFRQRDYAPNVLTFNTDTPLGQFSDVVLCAPVLQQQARQYKVPLPPYVIRILVHAIAHAIGLTHESRRTEQQMRQFEAQVLGVLWDQVS